MSNDPVVVNPAQEAAPAAIEVPPGYRPITIEDDTRNRELSNLFLQTSLLLDTIDIESRTGLPTLVQVELAHAMSVVSQSLMATHCVARFRSPDLAQRSIQSVTEALAVLSRRPEIKNVVYLAENDDLHDIRSAVVDHPISTDPL